MDRQFPPAGGTGLAVRQTNGSAFRPATFGAPLPSDGDAKGSKPTIWHDSPPGCAARQRSPSAQQHAWRNFNAENFMQMPLPRHARACRGHPRLSAKARRGWGGGDPAPPTPFTATEGKNFGPAEKG